MIRASLFALTLLAVACAPAETPPPEQPPAGETAMPQTREEATAQDTCGASQYQSMIGSNIAVIQLPADANIRVVQPDTVVTEDFRPDRLNIIADANGVITALECY